MTNDGGIDRLKRRLAAIPREVKQDVQKTLVRNAETMAGTMRQLAPRDEGGLVESITVTEAGKSTPAYSQPGGSMIVPDNAVAITVGNSDVRYPHLQEYGTKHHAAQPFFWPSVRMHKDRAARSIKSAVGRAVKKHWGRS